MVRAISSRLRRPRTAGSAAACDESGFTLIELMIVVLIIALLIAIALPTFAGARKRANDRATESRIRNVFTVERTYFVESQQYVDDSTGLLTSLEPALTYGAGMTPNTDKDAYIGVVANVVYVSSKSKSGTCFYLRDDASSGTAYAQDGACGPADSETYFLTGW